jgi:hypothetical protein
MATRSRDEALGAGATPERGQQSRSGGQEASYGKCSSLRSPAVPDESYRASTVLTEAERQMIDFLVEKALEAWLRNH